MILICIRVESHLHERHRYWVSCLPLYCTPWHVHISCPGRAGYRTGLSDLIISVSLNEERQGITGEVLYSAL